MLLPLTVVVARHLEPFPGEVGTVEWVNGWPRPLGVVVQAVMQLGTVGVELVVLAIAAVATIRTRPRVTVALGLALVLGHYMDDVVKRLVERPRPSEVLTTLTVREHPDGTSYPSGHTTLAVAMAVAIVPLLPRRWRPVPLGLAAVVAVGRLYVGVHWPTDLVGGAALGVLLGTFAWIVVPAPSQPVDEDYGPLHP